MMMVQCRSRLLICYRNIHKVIDIPLFHLTRCGVQKMKMMRPRIVLDFHKEVDFLSSPSLFSVCESNLAYLGDCSSSSSF